MQSTKAVVEIQKWKTNLSLNLFIKESPGLCDIWRVRNPKKKRYTFRQQHVTSYIQRRLDYFLVLNDMQEFINKTEILTALSTNHSSMFFSLSKNIGICRGKGLWNVNNSLHHKPNFVIGSKNDSKDICNTI